MLKDNKEVDWLISYGFWSTKSTKNNYNNNFVSVTRMADANPANRLMSFSSLAKFPPNLDRRLGYWDFKFEIWKIHLKTHSFSSIFFWPFSILKGERGGSYVRCLSVKKARSYTKVSHCCWLARLVVRKRLVWFSHDRWQSYPITLTYKKWTCEINPTILGMCYLACKSAVCVWWCVVVQPPSCNWLSLLPRVATNLDKGAILYHKVHFYNLLIMIFSCFSSLFGLI